MQYPYNDLTYKRIKVKVNNKVTIYYHIVLCDVNKDYN